MMRWPNASGVLATISSPLARSCATMEGSCKIASVAWLSAATIEGGVFAGARKAWNVSATKSA